MQPTQYILLQDHLSSNGSFILCDMNARGFPMLHASQGFVDLFGHTAAECVGVPCGSLVASPSILKRDPELRGAAGALGMAPGRVAEGLEVLDRHARKEVDRMVERPGEFVHIQVVNRKRSGKLFVCEVIMVAYEHPTLGWKFSVGLQSDITRDISVRRLLASALEGGHAALHESREGGVEGRFADLRIRDSAVSRYLSEKALEVWMGCMNKTLGVEKPMAPTKEAMSEMQGTASTASPGEGTENSSTEVGGCDAADELVGAWRCVVNTVEQVVEFSGDGNSVCIEALGQVARGTFEYDATYSPHRLSMRLCPGAGLQAPDPVTYIAKVEAGVLHLCGPCPAEGPCPEDFGGPGYATVAMTRAPAPSAAAPSPAAAPPPE